jgi:hypothetical protein
MDPVHDRYLVLETGGVEYVARTLEEALRCAKRVVADSFDHEPRAVIAEVLQLVTDDGGGICPECNELAEENGGMTQYDGCELCAACVSDLSRSAVRELATDELDESR